MNIIIIILKFICSENAAKFREISTKNIRAANQHCQISPILLQELISL